MSIIISSNTELICSGEVRLLLKVGPDGDIIVKPIRDEGIKYQFTMDDAITITSIADKPTAPPIDVDTNTEIDTNTNTNEYLSVRDRYVHNVHKMSPELIAELLMLQGIRQSKEDEYYKVTRANVFPFRLMSDDVLWKYRSIGYIMSPEDGDIEVPYPIESSHATRKRYIWEPFECTESEVMDIEVDWLPIDLDQLLIKTGAVMAGSYPLHHVIPRDKKNRWEPDDVDIFGLTLDCLRDIIAALINNDIKFYLYLRRLGHVDSYKLKMEAMDEYNTLNYLHMAHDEDDRPVDEEMDADVHRAKIIKSILTTFDIAACSTYYDGTTIHYNSNINKMQTSVRGACKRRMDKYKERGFKLTGDLKDYTHAMYE